MQKFTVPGTTVALLTRTTKMPSKSFSLPAIQACPGAFFGAGAICGENKEHTSCYATHGMYLWNAVKNAQQVRYTWLLNILVGSELYSDAVQHMVRAIANEKKDVFRVHDSGDIFNKMYGKYWYDVCSELPDIQFWIPTRSYRIPAILPSLVKLNSLSNVAVRPSALTFGAPAPIIEGLSAGTTASKVDYNCVAHSQDNHCLDCRACWSKDGEVAYRQH